MHNSVKLSQTFFLQNVFLKQKQLLNYIFLSVDVYVTKLFLVPGEWCSLQMYITLLVDLTLTSKVNTTKHLPEMHVN